MANKTNENESKTENGKAGGGAGGGAELFTPVWHLEEEWVIGRTLEAAYGTSDNAILLRFGPILFGGPDVWVGFKPAWRLVTDDEVIKTVRVLRFERPLPGDAMALLQRIAPNPRIEDPTPNKVIGGRVTGVHRNKAHGLPIPPSQLDSEGWYLELGPYYVELSWHGLGFHAPQAPRSEGGVQ